VRKAETSIGLHMSLCECRPTVIRIRPSYREINIDCLRTRIHSFSLCFTGISKLLSVVFGFGRMWLFIFCGWDCRESRLTDFSL